MSPISIEVSRLLSALETVRINPPGGADFLLMERMRQTPRSGKAVRIDRYGLDLPKQNLADHLKMLAELADAFLPEASLKVDRDLLACLIAFHDLAEAITGDTPIFTSPELAGAHYMTEQQKLDSERASNAVIAGCLPEPLRVSFLSTIEVLDDKTGSTMRFFLMLDKIEPIVSIWRYMCQYRDVIFPEMFLEAMTDFFTNPNVAPAAVSEEWVRLANFLQDKEMARHYLADGLPAETPTVLERLIVFPIEMVA